MTQINFNESDFESLKSAKDVTQVKIEKISDRAICKLIQNQLQKVNFDSVSVDNYGYDLRMRCALIIEQLEIDSFYIDSQRRLIYRGLIFTNRNDIVDLTFNNLCRPIYSYCFLRENIFWLKSLNCCNDTTDFINIYGIERLNKCREILPNLCK